MPTQTMYTTTHDPEVGAKSGSASPHHYVLITSNEISTFMDDSVELDSRMKESIIMPESDIPKTKRVVTLDVFRGLTIAVMILVDDAGGQWPHINHSPWNGCTLADFVMPFFLFIVGVATALAFKRVRKPSAAVQKVVIRTIKLIFWGLILQGGYSHAPDDLSYGVDMTKIRWCGILQRIALGYAVVALVEIAITHRRTLLVMPDTTLGIFQLYKWHWLMAVSIIMVYCSCVYGLYVPDWQFRSSYTDEILTVTCGVKAHFGPPCNAVGYIDRMVLGLNHMYQTPEWTRALPCDIHSPSSTDDFRPGAPTWCQAPFEPEGTLSSILAILSAIIGVHYGHVLIHYNGHTKRLLHWILPALILVLLGLILHYSHAIPLNKQLYSLSYVCLTGGSAGLVFSFFYVVIDIHGFSKPFLLLKWMGLNSMFVFVMAAEGIFPAFINGWYYKSPNNTLVYWIQKHIFVEPWNSLKVGTLLYVLFGEILFWGVISGFLHWRKIYWTL